MTPLQQIPDMQPVAVAATQQNFRIHSVLHHAGRSPFAGDDGVESQVPPEVISKFLRATIQLPLPEDIEALVIHHENSAGTTAVGSSVRAAKVSGSITFTICGLRGSGLVSMICMRDELMPGTTR